MEAFSANPRRVGFLRNGEGIEETMINGERWGVGGSNRLTAVEFFDNRRDSLGWYKDDDEQAEN